ncbi:unnamed protein product [Discula destructiva]
MRVTTLLLTTLTLALASNTSAATIHRPRGANSAAADLACNSAADSAVDAAADADVVDSAVDGAADADVVDSAVDAAAAAADDDDDNTAAEENPPAAAAAGGGGAAADFGSCTPTMDFQLGRAEFNRAADEGTFFPTDAALVANSGQLDALNPNIITNFICDQLTNVCGANDAAKTACASAQQAVEGLGARDASTADAFNSALGL